MFAALLRRLPFAAKKAAPGPQLVWVQTVRVRRPTLQRLRRAAGYTLVFYIGLNTWWSIAVERMTRGFQGLETVPADEEEFDGVFVPLPKIELVPAEYPFAVDSPEWQGWVKLSGDPERVMQLRSMPRPPSRLTSCSRANLDALDGRVAEKVASKALDLAFNPNNIIARQWGRPLSVRGINLEPVFYPYKLPEPHQLGLVFWADDGGPWFRRRAVSANYWKRLDRIVYPWAVFSATGAFGKCLLKEKVGLDLDAVAALFPAVSRAPTFPGEKPWEGMSIFLSQSQVVIQKGAPKKPNAPPKKPEAPPNPTPSSITTSSSSSGGDGGSSSGGDGQGAPEPDKTDAGGKKAGADEDQSLTLRLSRGITHGTVGWCKEKVTRLAESTKGPVSAFKRKLGEHYTWGSSFATQNMPPPGCVKFVGSMIVATSVADIHIDIRQYYDHIKDEFRPEGQHFWVREVSFKRPLKMEPLNWKDWR